MQILLGDVTATNCVNGVLIDFYQCQKGQKRTHLKEEDDLKIQVKPKEKSNSWTMFEC